ncbi:DNA-3-methyladenine glycosylase 2 family protein [Microvirga rosea]|uniref:DNA-3-methyladenine glycosylase 2 family protein n=1 Tax=Microvirga rosea TaxID=2715425 RepID=UPI001D0A114A|nr:AlkA N-terminal domain-containing protein [Microvirga rosea]MCB8820376.1 helix-turn-helix domain-containing protein [Microvirga rosea]
MTYLDPQASYRALQSRDRRFDGRLFVGVTSTGIYCRPICPATTAKFENCRFYSSAAAAQEEGFRPCLRCRPETAPDLGSWRGTSNTVSRGLALIAEGALDGEDASVEALADRLGVGERQLRRLFQEHLGVSPIAVAQTRRILFAKQLIHDTRLPMSEVAMAAGFGSVRRFNETFQKLYRRPPSAIRKRSASALPEGSSATTGVAVRLRYRAPYDWDAMMSFLKARAIDGMEQVEGNVYRRTVLQDGQAGTVVISHLPENESLEALIHFPEVRALPSIVARVRRVFDLGADIMTVSNHLAQDPQLARLIETRPGLRVPGGWDGFEVAMRAILGQQVSVEAGRQLGSKLVRICGTTVSDFRPGEPSLALAFPTAAQVLDADLSSLGMPLARKAALKAVAEAALADPLLFQPRATVEETVARLSAIRGIGEWTAHYIALRAAREPDAFPASDIGLLRGAAGNSGARPSPVELQKRAEAWRPWRAYAAQLLWAADSHSV